MLVEFNCNRCARRPGATATNMPVGSNKSADHVTMMPGLLVGRKQNRLAHWPYVTLTDMPADPVQQYPAFLLVGCSFNIHYCWCDVTNTHDCWPRSSLNGKCAGSVPHY